MSHCVHDSTRFPLPSMIRMQLKFLMQIGGRTQNHGNADTKNLNRPADAFFHSKGNEIFVG